MLTTTKGNSLLIERIYRMSSEAENQYVWIPPSYNTSHGPSLSTTASLAPDSEFEQNFARSAKWCPDGSLALAQCENRTFEILDLPPELLQLAFSQTEEPMTSLPSWPKHRVFPQAAPILDFIWYPRATPRDPASFCFVASVRESPVKLLDASTGRLRASYKIVDHRERQIAPHSMSFNGSADRLYCGFEDAIEVFDLNNPGEGTRLATTPSRKSRDGLKGIISALAFCPSYDPSSSMFAAGTLTPSSSVSPNIALFSEDTGGKPVGWIGDVKASVTQLAFNPMKPHVLYASFRRHGAIYGWDLRGDTSIPVQIFRPNGVGARPSTNQRIKFDIDLSGKWMSVGDQHGDVSFFDLDTPDSENVEGSDRALEADAVLRYTAHKDAVGSVAFHPLRPFLLSVSGSRHFDINSDINDQSSSSEEDEEEDQDPFEAKRTVVRKSRQRRQSSVRDSVIKLWNFEDAD